MDEKHMYRQMSIQRYKSKRRTWGKKVAYECRKKVADDRLRVKGRFISKEDHENIVTLLPTDPKSVFDGKNNLDLRKFQSKFKLFTRVNPKRISKRTILERIRQKVKEESAHGKLLQRIADGHQIFVIECD
jgi:hypothetical protein